MILFRIESHFQLICAIHVKNQLLANETVDLHLLYGSTDFEQCLPSLEKMKLFRKIECFQDRDIGLRFNQMTAHEKRKYSRKVPNWWEAKPDVVYDSIYFGFDALPNKLFFYWLCQHQKAPDVFILDEGTATYYKDLKKACGSDGIDHQFYKDNQYLEKIKKQYLYNTDLFACKYNNEKLEQLPPIDESTLHLLKTLYGDHELPKEKYIYFATPGIEHKWVSNEIDLLNMLGNQVGKENIIVKLHPRATNDFVSMHGYKVMEQEKNVPWEMFLLSSSQSSKVMVAINSNAALAPFQLFRYSPDVIFLESLYLGTPFFSMRTKEYRQYMSILSSVYNKDEKHFFNPKSEDEFVEIIKYVNGRGIKNA